MYTPYIGEIQIIASDNAPQGWAVCEGQLLSIAQNQALFQVIGTTYGGNGVQTFGLPDLRGSQPVMFGALSLGQQVGAESETLNVTQLPAHVHAVSGLTLSCASSTATSGSPVNAVPAVEARGVTTPYSANANSAMSTQAISGFAPVLASAGGNQPHENRAPFLALKFMIALSGFFPSQAPSPFESGREPMVAEISMFAGSFAPSGWARCEGQLLPISQNTALFSLLGTYFGGIEYGHADDGGVDAVQLLASEIPQHTHAVASGSATPALKCVSGAGNATTPVGNLPAAEAFAATAVYRPTADASVMSYAVSTQVVGSGLAHNNPPPSLAINFIIAMQGEFPARQ
jgi:microcystin-dependent protein